MQLSKATKMTPNFYTMAKATILSQAAAQLLYLGWCVPITNCVGKSLTFAGLQVVTVNAFSELVNTCGGSFHERSLA